MVDSGNVHQLELDGRHLTVVGTALIPVAVLRKLSRSTMKKNLTLFVLNYAGPVTNL